MMQNNKLTRFGVYYRGDEPVEKVGFAPSKTVLKDEEIVTLDPEQPLKQQLKTPCLTCNTEYQIILPLDSHSAFNDRLLLGISYNPLYSFVRDVFALSVVIFFTAFVFMFGALVFVDTNISYFMKKVQSFLKNNARSDLPSGRGHLDELSNFDDLMEELEKHEDHLTTTKNMLQTIFNGLHTGVALLATDGSIVMVNRYLMELFDSKHESDLVGKNCCSALRFPDQVHTDICMKSLKSKTSEKIDLKIKIRGEERFFIYETYPILGTENLPVAVIAQYHDVTNERKAQSMLEDFNYNLQSQLKIERQKLEESHRQLLQSHKLAAVGELAGGVAHEINNPNGIILAGARYVLNKMGDSPDVPEYVGKYLHRIITQATRIDEIISGLLTFSRRRQQKKESIDIRSVIDEVADLTGPSLLRKRVVLHKNMLDKALTIFANQNELVQVFLNLFNNAVDAMPDGGAIFVSSAEYVGDTINKGVSIKVRNTGEDIPEEIIDKIKEPFFTTKPVGKGTGLGLSVSHGIIEDHQGIMNIRNHPEGGAEFEIILPLES